jgi:hypothetical protein
MLRHKDFFRMRQGSSMVTLTCDSNVVASPTQVSCDLDRELVILDLHGAIYHGLADDGRLTDVSLRIWSLLQERRSVGAIRDQLMREYDVDAERCESDLLALLTELEKHSLIVVTDAAAA